MPAGKRTPVRWVWADPLIALATVPFSLAALFLSLFDRTGNLQHWCARWWGRFILFVGGVRVRVEGLDHVPRDRPCILATNHQSNIDIPVLLSHLPVQFRFAAKDSLFRVPFLGWFLRRSRHVLVHRGNPRAAIRSLREAGKMIDSGVPVLVFPEGTRSPDGRLGEFKKGAFLLSRFTDAPIVPIILNGTRQILPKHSFKLMSGSVTLEVAPPVSTRAGEAVDVEELSRSVRSIIEERFLPPA